MILHSQRKRPALPNTESSVLMTAPTEMVRHNISMSSPLRDALNLLARQKGVTGAALTNAAVAWVIEAAQVPEEVVSMARQHDEGRRLQPTKGARRRLRLDT
jgi:hypothetical protein